MSSKIEEEERKPGEHPPLVGDRIGQDHVVGADPVAGDHQQALVIDGVQVPDFARADFG